MLKLDRVCDGHLLCRQQQQDAQVLPSQLQLRSQLSLIPGRRPQLERVPGGAQLLYLTEGAVVNLRAKLLNLRERQYQKLEHCHRQRGQQPGQRIAVHAQHAECVRLVARGIRVENRRG